MPSHLAFITGTSRGLGKAISECLLTKGFQVIGLARRFGQIDCDLSSMEEVTRAISAVTKTPLPSDLQSIHWINNAATEQPICRLEELHPVEFQKAVNANLIAPTLLVGAFLDLTHDLDIDKRIVNVSSGLARRPLMGSGSYCMGKAGLEMLTRQIAEEQLTSPYPVSAISALPGIVDTAMQERFRSPETNTMTLDKFVAFKNEGKLVPPETVAAAFCRDLMESPITTGKAYLFSGGRFDVIAC